MTQSSPANATSDRSTIDVPLTVMTDEQSLANLRTQRIKHHGTILVISLIAIVLSFAFSLRDSTDGAIVFLGGKPLPPLCTSRAWLGIECPGCGLTRSFVALASGDLHSSIQSHRFGWLLFAVAVGQIPYRIFVLRELRHTVVERQWPRWFAWALFAILLANWLYNLAM